MSRLAIKTRTLTDAEKDFRGVDQLVKLLESAAWVNSQESGTRLTVNYGNVYPGPDDRNAPWVKTLTDGTPIGLFTPNSSGGFNQVSGWIVGELKRLTNVNTTTFQLPSGWQFADGTNGTDDYSSEWVGTAPQYALVVAQFVGYS